MPGKRGYWEKKHGNYQNRAFFPSKAQFDLSAQYFTSTFTQNPQPVVSYTELHLLGFVMDNTDFNSLKILVAVDESEPSHNCLHQALQLINLRAATFLLLLVEAPVMMLPMPSASFGPGGLDTEISSGWDEAALLKLQAQRTQSTTQWAEHLCEQAGVQYTTRTEFGDPKHVICDVAKRENPNLIVIGSHGYGVVERVLIGSVSEYVVHHAQCPVLVVR